jgi:hypothetical protein
MLPSYEICRKHILAFQRRAVYKPDAITFPKFWNYKISLENAGGNILDERVIDDTASKLRGLLLCLEIRNSGLLEIDRLKRILRNIQPYYPAIRPLVLGQGEISAHRVQLESVYERLDTGINGSDAKDTRLSVVAKSALLMAVWGQSPRFDRLNRIRFVKWPHSPAPEKLPALSAERVWYRPDEFCAMLEELDKWALAWPATNYSKSFQTCFFDLCPNIPPGRQIDIVYHWKLPETWVDYRLQTQGSGFTQPRDNSIDDYYETSSY